MTTIDPTLPEAVRNFLASGEKLEVIRLDALGKWTHEGLDFENKKIIALFHRSVKRTEGGTWVLEIGRFTYPIEVEECGYFVKRLTKIDSTYMIHTTLGKDEELNPSTISYKEPDGLYCKLLNGFKARFIETAYLNIGDEIVEKNGDYFFLDRKLG